MWSLVLPMHASGGLREWSGVASVTRGGLYLLGRGFDCQLPLSTLCSGGKSQVHCQPPENKEEYAKAASHEMVAKSMVVGGWWRKVGRQAFGGVVDEVAHQGQELNDFIAVYVISSSPQVCSTSLCCRLLVHLACRLRRVRILSFRRCADGAFASIQEVVHLRKILGSKGSSSCCFRTSWTRSRRSSRGFGWLCIGGCRHCGGGGGMWLFAFRKCWIAIDSSEGQKRLVFIRSRRPYPLQGEARTSRPSVLLAADLMRAHRQTSPYPCLWPSMLSDWPPYAPQILSQGPDCETIWQVPGVLSKVPWALTLLPWLS